MSQYSWSYSAFSTALTCMRKFKHVYVDRLTPDYESGDLAFGSALHLALNEVLTGGDGEQTFLTYWNTYKGKDLQYGRFKWTELENLGVQFVAKFKKGAGSKFDEIQCSEKRLFGEYKGIKLEGTPDLLAEFEGIMTLVDFKTSSARYEPDKAKVSLQLYLYAYLCITQLKVTPAQIMYLPFLKSTGGIQNPVIEPFREEDMYAALDEMVEYVRTFEQYDVMDGETVIRSYPKNFNQCFGYGRKCEFWSRCWPEKEVKE